MIILPPWLLSTAVIVIGALLTSRCTESATREERRTGEVSGLAGTIWIGSVTGAGLMMLGTYMTWISPHPEPIEAWLTIGAIGALGAWAGGRATTETPANTGIMVLLGMIVMSTTLIIRANIHQFQ